MAKTDDVGMFRLTPDQKQRMQKLEGDIKRTRTQIEKLEKLGVSAERLKRMLDDAEAMRSGLLEQFGKE